jgi:ornithine carbamoyltransferase
MPVNLKGRNFLKELDFTTDEFKFLLSLARDLKKARKKMWEEGGRKEKQRESRDKPPASGSLIGTVGGIFRDALFN